MTLEEIRAHFVQQMYEIFDGHECWIACALCREQALPTKGAVYDYRRVVHATQCIVPGLQSLLGIESGQIVVDAKQVQDVPRIADRMIEKYASDLDYLRDTD